MAACEVPESFVPVETPALAESVNFHVADGAATNQASVFRARRPLSGVLATRIVDVFERAEAAGVDVEALFPPDGTSALDEMRVVYLLAGKDVPGGIVDALKDPRHVKLRREVRYSATPFVRSRTNLEAMDDVAQGVFGVGLTSLAAPINFLFANPDKTVDELKGLLADSEVGEGRDDGGEEVRVTSVRPGGSASEMRRLRHVQAAEARMSVGSGSGPSPGKSGGLWSGEKKKAPLKRLFEETASFDRDDGAGVEGDGKDFDIVSDGMGRRYKAFRGPNGVPVFKEI